MIENVAGTALHFDSWSQGGYAFSELMRLDVRAFGTQLLSLSPGHLLLGIVLIYAGFALRAARWSVLLRPVRRVSWTALMPVQAIGFTAVAFFGRLADLSRPFLTARQLGTSVSMQLAIYSIERAFDLAAAAILFSTTLALAPADMPHHAAFTRAGVLSMVATLLLAGVAVAIRLAGDRLGAVLRRMLGRFSTRLAETAAKRMLELQEGFGAITSVPQFLAALALSLVMWTAIALTYLEAAHAFRTTPELTAMTFTSVMLLLASSLGASVLQLPVLGWITQVAAIAAAYRGFFGVPLGAASACAIVTFGLTSLSIVPAGLLAAKLTGVRLREASGSGRAKDA